ncbi:hypothetical protein RLW55_05800 [Hyphomicrobium sp. B1]|uniref:hypothetical protein n=1 Tax=unclassified Hyphomicrobium TaxID=2619925 RepID=UPI0039C15899
MSDESDRPAWDDDEGQRLVGKIVLVGITYMEPDYETVIRQEQYFGTIVSADSMRGFQIDCMGGLAGTTKFLPPDLRSLRAAAPGEYRLRSTGEIVVNPDVISTWTLSKEKK